MSDQPFVHLHVHTEYSLLDGLSRIPDLVAHAKEMDMSALAITDHGAMFGVIDFYRECKTAGVKPIIGMEGYLARRGMQDREQKLDSKSFHLLLLAKNEVGYQNLLKIASASQLEGYYYRPRIDRAFLEQHAEGLIATSGCLAAQIPGMVMSGHEDEARDMLDWYLQVFGKDSFFLELQNHDIAELKTVNDWLIQIGRRDDVRFLATNDVHYVLSEDYDPHDTLLCIQSNAQKGDTNRLKMSDNSYYLASSAEMWRAFGHINDGEPLLNTLLVAEMCNLDLDTKGYHLPIFAVPEGYDTESYLRYLCAKGLRWRYPGREDDQQLNERLDYELGIIHKMGFETYFLIVWDLCQFARSADIWWNVRGSGAGSVAAYCLGITSIDPLENKLLFERFLNPGRVSMPDIDMDFPDDRRGEMIAYTARKYGEDKVAAIITFGTLGAKAAVRDVGRTMGLDLNVVNQAARLIPTEPKPKPVKTYVEENPDLKKMYETSPELRQVIDLAASLQGVNRHASTHAAGIIVADRPLVEYLPLHRQTKESADSADNPLKAVTQFPMETCESIGLLKIDFLGLSTLTIMRRAADLIEKHHGVRYTMDNIPYRFSSDPEHNRMLKAAFDLIGRGETVGVFQVEGGGMQQMLKEMRPSRFEHIIAAISLYRPGPMEYIPEYNARMHSRKPVEYHHRLLEPILAETYGICVSGDTLVFDALTGQRYRIDALESKAGDFFIQGIDSEYKTALGRVSRWAHNGAKEVYRLTLRNGASIKATANHLFLTEDGWKKLEDLRPNDYVATPPYLVEPAQPVHIEKEKLRVLAYLIADGSLSTCAAVDFVNKEPYLIDEYVRCLGAFENVQALFLTQIHDVTRVMTKNRGSKGTSSLLAWMRELGLKYPPAGRKLGGYRSQEKFIPDFVFRLNTDDLTYFLASLWDCDGYMGNEYSHYRTISDRLANDVQQLLLRLGISSTIHSSNYPSKRGERQAHQATVYDTAKLAALLHPYLLTEKARVVCNRYTKTTIDRTAFIAEVDAATNLSHRKLMEQYGVDRQHFIRRFDSDRISSRVVKNVAEALSLQKTLTLINLIWQPVEAIESAGIEDVYDLTVDNLHNFIANGIIVHNCVYQEQIMQIASDLFGYSLGDADLMRRAVSKKKKEDLQKHRDIFLKNGPEHGVDEEIAGKIFDDIEYFANYGFNKCLVGSTEIVDARTGRLHPIEDLASDRAKIEQTLTCDTESLCLKPGNVIAAIANGVKLVFRLRTQSGRQIEATANHPFFTPDGWRTLRQLSKGDQIAVPRRIPVEGCKVIEFNAETGSSLIGIAYSIIEHELDEPDGAIPGEIFELTNEQVAEFLACVWEDGGSVDENEQVIFCPIVSRRGARQLQHLLLRLGIASRLSKGQGYHQIWITGETDILAFYERIGRHFDKTYDQLYGRLEKLVTSIIAAGNPSTEIQGDVLWDKIFSIKYIGTRQTYDLTIEGTHNFVANDFIVHNSHAADYAVITVQTAFLKTHYPAEYMTALLSVYGDDSAKVTAVLAECKRTGIPILPPDVNYSQLDFDIEAQPGGARGIRFGLAAIKGAGVAALQHIIDARNEGGAFTSLEDFCRRVDLRQVGKRTIESLVKVGAMRAFGRRAQLANSDVIERMTNFSGDIHRAKEVGQISMFGDSTGVADDMLTNLPAVEEASQREMLNWERDLLGFYVTSHPLDVVARQLQYAEHGLSSTHDIKEFGPEKQGTTVTTYGMVAAMRKLVTKNGESMCVVTMEDLFGTMEVVLFPRTWRTFEDLVTDGAVLKFTGKVDLTRNEPQILCDAVGKDFDIQVVESNGNGNDSSAYFPAPAYEEPPWTAPDEEPDAGFAPPDPTDNSVADDSVADGFTGNGYTADEYDGEKPPAPPARFVTIHFERTSDQKKDQRRLETIYHTLISFPGQDRFLIVVHDAKGDIEMEFPDDTTCYSDKLRDSLAKWIDINAIEIE